MGYSKNAFQGFGWNGMVNVLAVFAVAAKYYVIARVLTPYDVGLAQYAIIALGLFESLTETGINTTVVQSKKSISYFLDTAWVISILRGLLISILMILGGLFMAGYFNEPKLVILMTVASFSPLIKGFINPAIISLYKDLRFFRDSVYRFSLIAVDAVASITFGLIFHSVYAIIFAMISAALFEVGISFIFFNLRPRFTSVKSRVQEILANARGLNPLTILGYLVENLDNLLVGKVVGTEALGIYANAYALAHKFTLQFAKSVQYGTFSVYVKFAEEKKRLRRAFLKTVAVSLGTFTLVSLPFLIFPKEIVTLFLGDKWLAIVPILRPLVFASLVQSFIAIATAIFTSTKNYWWLNVSMLVNVISLVVFITILGHDYGLQGSVYGVLISRLLVLPIVFVGMWKVFYEP